MARQDLVSAFRNALERGETIDEAKVSLTNAGYKREEVEEASREIEKIRPKKLPTIERKFHSVPSPSKAS